MIPNMLQIVGIFLILTAISNGQKFGVKYLTPGIAYHKLQTSQNFLSIYCYKGMRKHLFHIWQTVHMLISLQPEDYTLYSGCTPDEVYEMFENHKSSWSAQLFTHQRKSVQVDPFNQSCIGIETSNDYEIAVSVIHIDFWKILLLSFGVCLFLAAPRLSSNPVFYYICGVFLGITTSLLIVFYFISKLIPKKPAVYGFFIGGWAIGAYIFKLLWHNIRSIALHHQSEVLGYIFVSGILSFIVCYRFGPVTDPRSRNLIKWALQCASIAAIFYSSEYRELSVLFILALLLYYNFPSSWTSSMLVFWKKRFPPKTKLLTEDEYHEQGARETVKALEGLRVYCSSPECKQWKTILSLRQPIRFAQFVEGKSHLVDSEILEYESESRKSEYLLTDDSDSEEDY